MSDNNRLLMDNKLIDFSKQQADTKDSMVTVAKKDVIEALKMLAAAKRKLEALMK